MTREEIAEQMEALGLRRLGDAVRALPVINRCSDCFWLALDVMPRGTIGTCMRDDARDMVIGRVDGPPPARCPLRGKR